MDIPHSRCSSFPRLLQLPSTVLNLSLRLQRGFREFWNGQILARVSLLSEFTANSDSPCLKLIVSNCSSWASLNNLKFLKIKSQTPSHFQLYYLKAKSAADLSSSRILLKRPFPVLRVLLLCCTDSSFSRIIVSSTPAGRRFP